MTEKVVREDLYDVVAHMGDVREAAERLDVTPREAAERAVRAAYPEYPRIPTAAEQGIDEQERGWRIAQAIERAARALT